MSVEEFAQGPAQSGILTDRCTSKLFPCFPSSSQGDGLPLLAFHSEPQTSGGVSRRSPVQHDREGADSVQVEFKLLAKFMLLHYLLVRFQQIESRWGYSGTSDKIRSAQSTFKCLK